MCYMNAWDKKCIVVVHGQVNLDICVQQFKPIKGPTMRRKDPFLLMWSRNEVSKMMIQGCWLTLLATVQFEGHQIWQSVQLRLPLLLLASRNLWLAGREGGQRAYRGAGLHIRTWNCTKSWELVRTLPPLSQPTICSHLWVTPRTPSPPWTCRRSAASRWTSVIFLHDKRFH